MKVLTALLVAASAWAQSHSVAPQQSPGTEKPGKSEALRYNVNWPSGLSLGEGQLTASLEDGQWSLSFLVEAAVPGFVVRESAKSLADTNFCSAELRKNATRGKRTIDETTTFDQKKMTAVRKTNKGGKTDLTLPACAKDALTYVFFLRHELAAGRLPQAQNVYYGAAYQVRVQYTGVQTIRVGGAPVEADRLLATIKGPASEITADMFFARDAVRTPLLIQTPLAMGKFALELAR
jgi:hypothetical protein